MMAQAPDTGITAEEQATLNKVMQMLEATPDTTAPTGLASVVPGVVSDDIPAKCEKLAILVSTGKSKEAIGVHLTHDQVKRLTDKDVDKYCKRYEAYIGNKTTDSLIDSLIMSKGVGMVVSVDDVRSCRKNSRTTLSSPMSCQTLLGVLLYDADDGWRLAMLLSSLPNTSSLIRMNPSPT